MMRTTKPTSHFRQDFKREKKTPRGHRLDALVATVTAMLAADMPLSDRRHDHAMAADFDGFRDCHVHSELVLIYRKPDAYTFGHFSSKSYDNFAFRFKGNSSVEGATGASENGCWLSSSI